MEIELAFPGTGLIARHYFEDWPVGAFFWRNVGETKWQPIPGRTWDKAARRGTIDGDEPRMVLRPFVRDMPSALCERM